MIAEEAAHQIEGRPDFLLVRHAVMNVGYKMRHPDQTTQPLGRHPGDVGESIDHGHKREVVPLIFLWHFRLPSHGRAIKRQTLRTRNNYEAPGAEVLWTASPLDRRTTCESAQR
ncbi:hypothetical protein ABIB83_005466 [Bradyrhizobium sp. I1.8.5]|uniref:hypothetical protein n=1 Tax=Bradyrhizobium sp. I1.8.5 TaxID=3156365 RepID=UPI003393A368